MGLTRKLSEKTWWFIQENHISDDVLFLFLSLGSSWRQGFFVVCCQEQYQRSSRWSRLAPEQNYSHLPSPDDPWCLTPIFGSPQICILYSQRCESKGRKTGALITSVGGSIPYHYSMTEWKSHTVEVTNFCKGRMQPLWKVDSPCLLSTLQLRKNKDALAVKVAGSFCYKRRCFVPGSFWTGT